MIRMMENFNPPNESIYTVDVLGCELDSLQGQARYIKLTSEFDKRFKELENIGEEKFNDPVFMYLLERGEKEGFFNPKIK